jgi:hypothetical protein
MKDGGRHKNETVCLASSEIASQSEGNASLISDVQDGTKTCFGAKKKKKSLEEKKRGKADERRTKKNVDDDDYDDDKEDDDKIKRERRRRRKSNRKHQGLTYGSPLTDDITPMSVTGF